MAQDSGLDVMPHNGKRSLELDEAEAQLLKRLRVTTITLSREVPGLSEIKGPGNPENGFRDPEPISWKHTALLFATN